MPQHTDKKMNEKKKMNGEKKMEKPKALTAKQEKNLPPALKAAILAKRKK